jgi:anhydro-N-acetylmuramic acid kinase
MTPVDPHLPLFVGLMSGTSADGIDAALVQFPEDGGCRFIHGHTHPWERPTRELLIALGQGGEPASLDALGQLDAAVGLAFAAAANQLLAEAGLDRTRVRAIGSHGQTIRHRPLADPAFTWQIGDASRIAELTGITTVADFRRRDVAAGGHGAPLMPAFHLAMLGSTGEDRAVLNLGGIANLSLIARDGSIRGFDTGPANALLDGWCQRHLDCPYDADGAFAARGVSAKCASTH